MSEDSKRFEEYISSYMYLKGQRIDEDLQVATDNLHQMKRPDAEHIERVRELLYRKMEFEETCREVRLLVKLYLI